MNWIQGLLIASIFALVVFLLRSRRSVQSQAWVKVGFLAFMFAGVYAVLRPNDTTVVARGTDLMLYALIIAFSFSTLNTYLRFKDLELRYARLARAVALEGAQPPE
jgi:small membrane protein